MPDEKKDNEPAKTADGPNSNGLVNGRIPYKGPPEKTVVNPRNPRARAQAQAKAREQSDKGVLGE